MSTIEPDLMLIWYNRRYVGTLCRILWVTVQETQGKGKEKNNTCR